MLWILVGFFLILTQCKGPCDNIECGPNGTCIFGECDCDPGWSGEKCDVSNSTDTPQKYLVQYINHSDTVTIDYRYNSDNRYTGYTYSTNKFQSIYDYIYENDTLFQNRNGVLSRKYFQSSDNQFIRNLYSSSTGNLLVSREYDFSDCGFSDVQFIDLDGKPNGDYLTYEWDNDCRKSLYSSYRDGKLDFTSESTYINGIKPFPTPWLYFFENASWIKEGLLVERISMDYDENGQATLDEYGTFSIEYQYDNDGYPIKEIQSFNNGEVEEASYEYR